jgi:chemotaxis family two-component system response regulator Rcp1
MNDPEQGKTMKTAIEVLLVDDNAADSELTTELLSRSDHVIHIYTVSDGLEALAFLRREGKYSNAPTPHLMMLDLSMPRKNGWEVLRDVKSDSALKKVTVVVFSASEAWTDIVHCLELGANSYVNKPGNLTQYASKITAIENYWFNAACIVRQEGM